LIADVRSTGLNTPPEADYFLPALQRPETFTNNRECPHDDEDPHAIFEAARQVDVLPLEIRTIRSFCASSHATLSARALPSSVRRISSATPRTRNSLSGSPA
jgi:hypothetical protein